MDTAGEQTFSDTFTGKITRILENGRIAAFITIVAAVRGVGRKVLVEETGARAGSTGDLGLDEAVVKHAAPFLSSRQEACTFKVAEFAAELEDWREARLLFERIEPEPHVVICGAGHVGASLAHLAHTIGYRVTLIDDRAEFVTRERFPQKEINLIPAEDWNHSVQASIGTGRGVSVAVVTRGHKEDEECMKAVLAVRPDYVGMIGSKRRTNIVLSRLRELGVDEAQLSEVRAPVGLDIAAITPEEVALAILAEIVAVRRGGTGTPLSAWRRE